MPRAAFVASHSGRTPPDVIDRILLAVCCFYFAAIAVWLLIAPLSFYSEIPGVAASGPANLHLLRDVGVTYAVLAAGFIFGLKNYNVARFAVVSAALYLAAHAALHAVIESSGGALQAALAEAPGIYFPALAAAALAARFLSRKGFRDESNIAGEVGDAGLPSS
jgi:hypothetical protein